MMFRVYDKVQRRDVAQVQLFGDDEVEKFEPIFPREQFAIFPINFQVCEHVLGMR